MSSRLATRIGLPAAEERAAGALDVARFHEPTVGARARTKGSLFLVAQVTGSDPSLGRAAQEALDEIERDYYYDLSVGALGALAKAIEAANRRLYHHRRKLGIGKRGGVGVVAVAVRGRELHVAKLGPASAVVVRGGRMYELPPPPAVADEDPRVRQRRVAGTLGEALQVEPYTWQGELAAGDRIALVSRNLAHVVGVDELKRALDSMRPTAAAEHLQQLFAIRGGSGSDGLLVVEVDEVAATATTRQLEPVRPAEPLAGLPDESPVPLADAIGRLLHRTGAAIDALQASAGRGLLRLVNVLLAFVPHRRPAYPRTVSRTDERESGRRRRLGLAWMVVVAGIAAAGVMVGSLPSATPTDAIPRAQVARQAITDAQRLVVEVEDQVDGRDLVARAPEQAKTLLDEAFGAVERAAGAGVAEAELEPLRARVDRGLDALYHVARIQDIAIVANLASTLEAVHATRMVASSDGALWLADEGRGRVIRVDPADGSTTVVYRAGQELAGGVAAAPWLIATAATDVVVVDRSRQAWRIDLTELKPRRMTLKGIEGVSADSQLLAALQHRPPLEIFNLYLVDAASGIVDKWSPPAVIPVTFPSAPQPFLSAEPDIPPQRARDLLVDANLWLLQRNTVTRVNFGAPLPQTDFSLDPAPDAQVRDAVDYRLFDAATIGERELFFVYDAANARIIGFQRADGAFVGQWMAPRAGAQMDLLADVVGLHVASVADGPPVAYLATPDRVVRVVLE
jgi:serine/threonine protein phosphatase PrpC